MEYSNSYNKAMVAVGDNKNGVEVWTLAGQHYWHFLKCCTRLAVTHQLLGILGGCL